MYLILLAELREQGDREGCARLPSFYILNLRQRNHQTILLAFCSLSNGTSPSEDVVAFRKSFTEGLGGLVTVFSPPLKGLPHRVAGGQLLVASWWWPAALERTRAQSKANRLVSACGVRPRT